MVEKKNRTVQTQMWNVTESDPQKDEKENLRRVGVGSKVAEFTEWGRRASGSRGGLNRDGNTDHKSQKQVKEPRGGRVFSIL